MLSKHTHQQQAQLAAYCRDGETPTLEGITAGRIATYRRLVFNNVRDALDRSYPLAKNALRTKEWAVLVNDFFEQHRCAHPQIWRMPEELIGFVEDYQVSLKDKYPFLIDLLTFEWKEIELHMMPNKSMPNVASEDPPKDAWVLNPEHELMRFSYPIHQKNARMITPSDQGDYHCLGFRDQTEGKVHFIHLTPLLANIVERLAEAPLPIETAYNKASAESDVSTAYRDVAPALFAFYEKMQVKGLFIR